MILLAIDCTGKFRKNYKLAVKRGRKIHKLDEIIVLLATKQPLPARCNAHKLVGNRAGEWECHIEPDWLLTYIVDDETLTLLDTGTHSDLF